ncbi:MAG: DUF2914 domain-containing protein [Candidatus Neomarinimicrobiota bacterium]|nr:DUF2914 domain-containing protein [Candidatus Neomarinimicrobiota bacterium]|tara:strand:+ start:592 stop:1299 length:708 start_codon:yes stop_codon:yes gene_type:complete
MIQGLLSDPSFIPVTIVFVLFILFAYWQQLNKYVPYLSIVYIAFTIVTALSYNNDNEDKVEGDYEVENASSNKYVTKDTLLNEMISENKNTSLQVESSSSFEIKEYVPKEKKIDDTPKTISVKRIIVCENINFNLRKPIRIRDVFLDTTSRIYCFAGIKNPDRSENISHYWEFNGEPYAKVHMNISVSEYFRCWSYITPGEGSAGDWSVSVMDDQNNILDKQEFTIERYKENSAN